MRRLARVGLTILCFTLGASARPAPPRGATAPQAQPSVAGAGPWATSAGHRFTVPGGWTVRERQNIVVLQAPEKNSWVAFVDAAADDADTAVALAWTLYRGDRTPELLSSAPVANQNGWQDGRVYRYRVAPGAARQLTARAMRHRQAWAVRLDDLADAVVNTRADDLRAIREGFMPGGYRRESFAGRTARQLDPARLDLLRRFVDTSRLTLEIPGVAMGIVQGGRTIFEGGFGVRELGRSEPVNADTLFPTASISKSLTSLLLATLVDEGRLRWETPVVDVLPQFRLADPASSAALTVKHLVCACAGLAYRNLDWELAPANASVSIAFDVLARMRPMSPVGTSYSYSNPIASVGGLLGGHVAFPAMELGTAYDTALGRRVFGPLGMKRTTLDPDRAMRGNYARTYGVTPEGDLAAIPPARERQFQTIRPAGGVWSNVTDLLAYVKVELSGGVLDDGSRYISESALKARREHVVKSGAHLWYGLGLETSTASGTPVVFHGGRSYGFRGDTIWLPEHGVGLVVLMNTSTAGHLFLEALQRKVLELLFDGEPAADSMVVAAAATYREWRASSDQSLRVPPEREVTEGLIGRYRNEALGEFRVLQSGGQTIFRFGAWEAPVGSRAAPDGTINFVAITPGVPYAFVAGTSAGRRTLTIRDAQNEYVFLKIN